MDLKKRDWHYIENPATFGLRCTKCCKENVYWSEFENHIWCYDCEEDIYYESGVEIFPYQLAIMLGISFDKIDLKTGKVIKSSKVIEYKPMLKDVKEK